MSFVAGRFIVTAGRFIATAGRFVATAGRLIAMHGLVYVWWRRTVCIVGLQ